MGMLGLHGGNISKYPREVIMSRQKADEPVLLIFRRSPQQAVSCPPRPPWKIDPSLWVCTTSYYLLWQNPKDIGQIRDNWGENLLAAWNKTDCGILLFFDKGRLQRPHIGSIMAENKLLTATYDVLLPMMFCQYQANCLYPKKNTIFHPPAATPPPLFFITQIVWHFIVFTKHSTCLCVSLLRDVEKFDQAALLCCVCLKH